MAKTIEQKFKKLDEVQHVLLRPGRYVGAITPHEEESYVYDIALKRMIKKTVTYNPGFLKLFDEVISNSVDHSKRPEGKNLDTIRIDVDQKKGEISIYDNGGIPVVKHKEHNQWIPEMIFELRAGSNFDDDDQAMLGGQNGEGAALTCIFSRKFIVETCDSKNKFKMIFEDNSQNRKPPKVEPSSDRGYTRITYYPDFEKLKCEFTDDNLTMILKRVVDVAGINTHLKVYWNGERIPTRSFKDYVELYLPENADYAVDETKDWKVAVASSDSGEFQHVSFVNGIHSKVGGTHIMYAGMQIWKQIREYIKKKHKVDVGPAELRQHMMLFIDCSMVNPRYNSQTKEELMTEPRDYKTSWTVPDKMINKIVKSSIIQSILDWAEAKAHQEQLRELRKLNKDGEKTNLKKVKKFHDATEKDRSKTLVFLCEGDCLEENTEILVYRNEELLPIPIKDINTGDAVLTHNNRLRSVLSTTKKVIEGIKITIGNHEMVASPDHRFIVYDKILKSFIEIQAKNLDVTKHQLVKSSILNLDHLEEIVSIQEISDKKYDYLIKFESTELYSSKNHKFYVWDMILGEFLFEKASNLEPSIHKIVMKKE